MNILYIAPHPFFVDRGSPIASRMALDVIDQRGYSVDLATYHEGRDISWEHVTIHRIPSLPFIRGVRPGFSLKKLVCDVAMAGVLIRLLVRNRYDAVHAVEEGVFFALLIKALLGVPYVYDMDSSMADQMIEKHPMFGFLRPVFRFFERLAVRRADAVVAVCDALGEIAHRHGAGRLVLLYDVPMPQGDGEGAEDLVHEVGKDGLVAMYVGNLEAYQGIDLLLESVGLAKAERLALQVVVIGGEEEDIERYREKARRLEIGQYVHFLGPRPVEDLYGYLAQADILLSPRIKGYNTPMKIYSYLESGKPILATRLWTHTQVLDDRCAVLTEPSPQAYAEGLRDLASRPDWRRELGEQGSKLVERKYSRAVFEATLNDHLDWLERRTGDASASISAPREDGA